jgi:hypothetical protein
MLAAVAAASAAGLATGLDTSQGQSPPAAFTLALPNSSPSSGNDGGRRGRSAGDILHFNRGLTQDGRRAGTFLASADAATRTRGLMVATLVLRGRGQLAVQGPLSFSAPRSTLAITGGTDEFAGAAGSVDVVSDRRDRVTLTVRLAG